jgi:hemerythrin-like domain-containing protein
MKKRFVNGIHNSSLELLKYEYMNAQKLMVVAISTYLLHREHTPQAQLQGKALQRYIEGGIDVNDPTVQNVLVKHSTSMNENLPPVEQVKKKRKSVGGWFKSLLQGEQGETPVTMHSSESALYVGLRDDEVDALKKLQDMETSVLEQLNAGKESNDRMLALGMQLSFITLEKKIVQMVVANKGNIRDLERRQEELVTQIEQLETKLKSVKDKYAEYEYFIGKDDHVGMSRAYQEWEAMQRDGLNERQLMFDLKTVKGDLETTQDCLKDARANLRDAREKAVKSATDRLLAEQVALEDARRTLH